MAASDGAVGVVLWGDVEVNDAGAGGLLREPGRATDAVLEAYRRHGTNLTRYVGGRHVFVLYDAAKDLLVAARDRVGIVPLFKRETRSGFEFASDARAFRRTSDTAANVNVALAAAYLAHAPMLLEETFFEDVNRVPPGHVLIVDSGGQRLERHWQPPPVGEGARWVTESELPRFGELLDAAVARPLDRGRGGIFLSGGLDSVSVAAAAVDYSRRRGLVPPVALSLLFPHGVSEEETQRGVAAGLGLELVALPFDTAVGAEGLLQAGLDLSPRLPAPLQNVWTPAYDALTAIGREHGIANVLTGGGGDEWLTVTPLIAADYIQRGEFGELFDYLGALGRSLNVPKPLLWRNVLWTHGARPLVYQVLSRARDRLSPGRALDRRRRALEARLAAVPAWVAPDAPVRALLVERLTDRYAGTGTAPPLGPGGRYFREMMVTLNHPLFALDVEEIYTDGQRNRAPHWDVYWDADLIEFLYRVPPQLLNQGGRTKGLVRSDVARRFPDFGFATQRKLVSRDFFVMRFYDELATAWPRLGGVRALDALGVADNVRVGRVVDEAMRVRSAPQVDTLWRLMSLEAWARAYA
jgi:asparagine synthetase B (glutamine-hydrolysing)